MRCSFKVIVFQVNNHHVLFGWTIAGPWLQLRYRDLSRLLCWALYIGDLGNVDLGEESNNVPLQAWIYRIILCSDWICV